MLVISYIVPKSTCHHGCSWYDVCVTEFWLNSPLIFPSTALSEFPPYSVEVLVLYGFRLLYQQYLFVKSELLQLNLRYSLCAFIESYMEFKKNNKDNTVDLFEQLIFSNIISDEKKVPATVDGLESIAKIIESIKCK